jgi:LysM repeat protein
MPLQAAEVMAPETWIVPALQPKQALAVYLKTTVEQLDWVNPGLTDPVAPGTLIAIPPSYRVSSGESLSSIATNTGLPADILQAANPKLSATGDLSPGTVLAVPPIIVMQEAVSLEAAAASLDASGDALLSANPDLANSSAIQAGTVLILPPESETETSSP